jgi:hypothetical protein
MSATPMSSTRPADSSSSQGSWRSWLKVVPLPLGSLMLYGVKAVTVIVITLVWQQVMEARSQAAEAMARTNQVIE